jgi:chromosomal replication initiator protein
LNSPPEFWDGVLRRLGILLPAYAFDAWVRPLRPELREQTLVLRCPSAFHRDRVRERYLARIRDCVRDETGDATAVDLALGAAPQRVAAAPVALAPVARTEAAPVATRVEQPSLLYDFDSFVVGPCNALAREAALAVAEDRQQRLNPLFITSASGLGKTHLARAIQCDVHRRGGRRVLYASAEAFLNDFMRSIRGRRMEGFKRRYREGCDLLVLEDVQVLEKKTATQLELFHTIGHLLDAGARVVLTADRLPRDITDLETRLRSQMTAGLVAEIEAPDTAVRRRILRHKAAAGGVRLPEECLELLVRAVRGSVRDLEGVLIQLVESASLLKRGIDLDLTRDALRKVGPRLPAAPSLEPAAVVKLVASYFRTTPETLASRSRRREVLVPRQLAMYLCRRYTDAPLGAIAALFDRDHPSVSNAVRVVERHMLERARLRYQVEALSSRLDELQRAE